MAPVRRNLGTVGRDARGPRLEFESIDPADRYRVGRRLAVGRRATVFEAVDTAIGLPVAIKRAHTRGATFAQPSQIRLHRDARAADGAVVAVFDQGVDSAGRPFVVMERLRGRTLAARLSDKARMDLPDVLRVGYAVAAAASSLHRAGIVHRDVKPGNVFLSAAEDGVRILDFASAHRIGVGGGPPRVGTPWYMPPEQNGRAGQAGPESDVYSLGCVLYEMLCGRVPFPGRVRAALLAHQRVAPLPPGKIRDMPELLSRTVRAMLRKQPERRPRDMAQVAHVLSRLL